MSVRSASAAHDSAAPTNQTGAPTMAAGLRINRLKAPAHRLVPVSDPASGGAGVWLLGTHGGSGVRCLSAVLPGTRCAGKVWPEAVAGRAMIVHADPDDYHSQPAGNAGARVACGTIKVTQ